jgi:hypothetical protein
MSVIATEAVPVKIHGNITRALVSAWIVSLNKRYDVEVYTQTTVTFMEPASNWGTSNLLLFYVDVAEASLNGTYRPHGATRFYLCEEIHHLTA